MDVHVPVPVIRHITMAKLLRRSCITGDYRPGWVESQGLYEHSFAAGHFETGPFRDETEFQGCGARNPRGCAAWERPRPAPVRPQSNSGEKIPWLKEARPGVEGVLAHIELLII